MVKEAKKVVGNLAKVMKSNRILMIVCVFVVMGLAVALIQFLQNKTLERFETMYTVNANGNITGVEELAKHGDNHTNCEHKNDLGISHTCGHFHSEKAAKNAYNEDLVNSTNPRNDVTYIVDPTNGKKSEVPSQ